MFNRKVCAEFWLKRAETGEKNSDLGISQTPHPPDWRLQLSCCQQFLRISRPFSHWSVRAACSLYKGLRPVSASSLRSCAGSYDRRYASWFLSPPPIFSGSRSHCRNWRGCRTRTHQRCFLLFRATISTPVLTGECITLGGLLHHDRNECLPVLVIKGMFAFRFYDRPLTPEQQDSLNDDPCLIVYNDSTVFEFMAGVLGTQAFPCKKNALKHGINVKINETDRSTIFNKSHSNFFSNYSVIRNDILSAWNSIWGDWQGKKYHGQWHQ